MTGETAGFKVIWNSPSKQPMPSKQSLYWQTSSFFASVLPRGSCVVVERLKLRLTSFISLQVGRPRTVGPRCKMGTVWTDRHVISVIHKCHSAV